MSGRHLGFRRIGAGPYGSVLAKNGRLSIGRAKVKAESVSTAVLADLLAGLLISPGRGHPHRGLSARCDARPQTAGPRRTLIVQGPLGLFLDLAVLLPGLAPVRREWCGEAELGVCSDHEPGPAVRCLRVTKPGPRPPEGLFEQGCLAIAGQVLDAETDQRALDDREFTVMVDPCGPLLQPGVKPVPGAGFGLAVSERVVHRDHGRRRQRGGPDQAELEAATESVLRLVEARRRPIPGRGRPGAAPAARSWGIAEVSPKGAMG